MMKRRIFLLIGLIISILHIENCGYRLAGTVIHIPDHVQSVRIQKFLNRTQLFEVGDFVQKAIEREFLKRSRMNISIDGESDDSVLEGEIVSFTASPQFETEKASDKSYQLSIVIRLVWVDNKNNEIIYDGQSLSYTDIIKMDSDDFFSQDSDTIDMISRKFASHVISLLFENF